MEKWSLGYEILRAYAFLVHRFFYRKVHVTGIKNVPRGQPVIFALNHQNALMDAMAVICTVPNQPVFLARADIFKKKTIISILHFIKILPVYRIRDGAETLGENEEIFNIVVKVLKNNNAMGIMPEGSHGDKKQLRSIKKGLFRVAFLAQAEYGNKPFVKIVPVGLDYSDYRNFRSDLLVNYGEPIEISQYWDLYRENQPKALNLLRNALAEKLNPLMINIQNTEYYDTYIGIMQICNLQMVKQLGLNKKNLYYHFCSNKKIIEILDQCFSEGKIDEGFKNKVAEYYKGLNNLNLRDWVFRKPGYSYFLLLFETLLLIILFPVFLYGLINNYLPFKLPVILGRKIKDPQFISSARYALAMITFLVFYPLQFTLISIFTDAWWEKWIYAISLPLSGYLAFRYYINFKKIRAKWRYQGLVAEKNEKIIQLQQYRSDILGLILK
jgi:1-acyl-sn-glycerol-3-phosphate acyltransferase